MADEKEQKKPKAGGGGEKPVNKPKGGGKGGDKGAKSAAPQTESGRPADLFELDIFRNLRGRGHLFSYCRNGMPI